MAFDKPYKDVPGTTIYDAEQARKGYHLNQFSMSLMKPENRERFLADQAAYLDEWPIGESVSALAALVEAGKIGAIGLSEVSAERLREARAVAPIAAVQNEYSLWGRNPELGMLDATRESGIALVAFSPVARGFSDGVADPADFVERDIRCSMPRFLLESWPANAALLARAGELIDTTTVSGPRYAPGSASDVDTETFEDAA